MVTLLERAKRADYVYRDDKTVLPSGWRVTTGTRVSQSKWLNVSCGGTNIYASHSK